jgi:acyl-coenzyme A synthetase/AMP-(fatty) acid ligase
LEVYVGQESRTPSLGQASLNIGSLLPRHARYRGNHPALVASGRTLTYREFNSYVNRLANALLAAGLKKGDKFARVDAKFQRIQDVVVYDEFPRNVAGKTLKREMRTAFAARRRTAG